MFNYHNYWKLNAKVRKTENENEKLSPLTGYEAGDIVSMTLLLCL